MIGKYAKLIEGKTSKELEEGSSVLPDETDLEEGIISNDNDIPFA